jgi:hypothetical protein
VKTNLKRNLIFFIWEKQSLEFYPVSAVLANNDMNVIKPATRIYFGGNQLQRQWLLQH